MIGSFLISRRIEAPFELAGFDKISHSNCTLFLKAESYTHEKWGKRELILLGDPIYEFDLERLEVTEIVSSVKGNYYGFLISEAEVLVFSSFLCILPTYYIEDRFTCSNSIELLKRFSHGVDIDRQFILETVLFNYPFSERTLYSQIKLLGSNQILTYRSSGTIISEGIRVSELFLKGAAPEKYSPDDIAKFFIKNVEKYLPPEFFSVSFTGGFDSRTLVGSALKYNRIFRTFSFGNHESPDIIIPLKQSAGLGFKHIPYFLEHTGYTEKIYREKALEIIRLSPGFNGFLYPQFPFIAEEESKSSNFLIMGYFGSELFRSLNVAGAVTSRALVEIFSSRTSRTVGSTIRNPKYSSVLNISSFSSELNLLENEISDYLDNSLNRLSRNEKFYQFILEESFRKLFGTLINTQQQYLNVRTPYLDYSFMEKLFHSKYGGLNREFFENNPAKRIAGQQIYAAILRNTSRELYTQITGKGYRPSSLSGPSAPLKLIIPALLKKFSRRVTEVDLNNLGLLSGFMHNSKELEIDIMQYEEIFNVAYIKNTISTGVMYKDEYLRDRILSTLSLVMSMDK